jgi:glycosyltransferase involved in cell wall biosynthesis
VRSTRSVENYKQANAIVAVSAEIAQTLAAAGVDLQKIRVIHSGIDLRLYNQKKCENRAFLRFVIIGALTKQKGHEVLIRAASLLRNESKSLPFEVIAAGQGELMTKLKKLANELEVGNIIHFVGWRDSRDLLPQCDILISSSNDGEGSNATIKEGWATGLPVIASDLASNLELVRDMENGATFSTGNPESLAKTMLALAVDPVLRKRLAKEGGLSVSNFTVERMALSYIKLYQELFNNYVLTATNKAGV